MQLRKHAGVKKAGKGSLVSPYIQSCVKGVYMFLCVAVFITAQRADRQEEFIFRILKGKAPLLPAHLAGVQIRDAGPGKMYDCLVFPPVMRRYSLSSIKASELRSV
jgi:hypothetical protein